MIVVNGEIAHYEQVRLSSQLFQKASAAKASENVWLRISVQQVSTIDENDQFTHSYCVVLMHNVRQCSS